MVRLPAQVGTNNKHKQLTMKLKSIISHIAIAACVVGLSAASAKEKDNQAELQAKAKITKEEAGKTALGKVPDGKIKEAELEDEDGKLIWSFDITRPGTTDITEVNVDAIDGKVVKVETESAAAEKEEADKEKEESAKHEKN